MTVILVLATIIFAMFASYHTNMEHQRKIMELEAEIKYLKGEAP